MNKGFVFYFKQAFKCSLKTIWKNKNQINSMLFFFMSLFSTISLVFSPVIMLANVRAAKFARNSQTMDIPQSLNKASQKSLWTMFASIFLEIIIYMGGLLFIAVGCALFFSIGLIIAQFADAIVVIYIVFGAPCLILVILYTAIMLVMFAPTAYVVESNPGIGAGEVISVCFNTLRSKGKLTTFLTGFVPFAIMFGVFAVFGVPLICVFVFCSGKSYFGLIVILLTALALVAMMFVFPLCTMTKNIAQMLLFEDIALDPVNLNKRTAGINIKNITGATIDKEEIADNLNMLFDDALEERTPDPENLVHKHMRKRIRPKKFQEPKPETKQAAEPSAPIPEEYEDLDYPEPPMTPEQPAPAPEAPAQTFGGFPSAFGQPAPAPEAPQPQPQPAPAPEAPQPQPQPAPAPEAPQPQPQPAPAPEAPQPQPQPAPNPYAQPQAAPNPYAQPQPQAAPNPYAQPRPQAAPNPYAQPQAAPNPYAQPRPQAAPNPYAQPQAAPNPYAQPQPQAAPNPYAQPQPQAAPNPYAQPQGVPNPYARPQGTPNPYAQPQAAPNPYAQPQQPQGVPNPYAQPGNPGGNNPTGGANV